MEDTIIERCPDKMIDYLQGFILLAYRDFIIYCNVTEYGIDDESKIPRTFDQEDSQFV